MPDSYVVPAIHSQNTPRGLDNNSAIIPSSYKVEHFLITNQYGKTLDIRNLVQSFTITEEIYSSIIVLNAVIRDNINFFEEFAICGQEIIKVRLSKSEGPEGDGALSVLRIRDPQEIDLYLTVKEYPNYVKSNETLDAQIYNIVAISEHAYLSNLHRIGRSVHGNTVDNICAIFTNDLNIPADKIVKPDSKYACVSQFDGVITIQSPLRAVEWLRNKSYDFKSSPFYVYTTIRTNKIIIKSWSHMIDNENLYPDSKFAYKFKMFSTDKPLTQSSYAENMARILSIKSNIKLDKLSQATKGGFANTTQITDFGVKTFVDKLFNIDKDKEVKENRMMRDNMNFKLTDWGKSVSFLNGLSLTQEPTFNMAALHHANITQVSTVAGSNNANTLHENYSNAVKSYLANIDSQSHEIVVYGDFALNPGKKIRIEIPKAANIKKFYDDVKKKPEESDDKDYSLSGYYVVAVAVHTFENGYYTTRAKIIRDNV